MFIDLPPIPDLVENAVSDFRFFIEKKRTLELKITNINGELPESIQVTDDLKISLPPSYLAFINKFGYLSVKSLSNGHSGIIGFFEPSSLMGLCLSPDFNNPSLHAVGFQRILDDNVENYYCFNHNVDLGNGEYEIISYFHDAKFVLRKKSNPTSINFNKHIAWVLREFMELYESEQ